MHVTNNAEFASYVKEHFDIGNNESTNMDDDDGGYFSDSELLISKDDKVTDDYFFSHLYDDDHNLKSPGDSNAAETKPPPILPPGEDVDAKKPPAQFMECPPDYEKKCPPKLKSTMNLFGDSDTDLDVLNVYDKCHLVKSSPSPNYGEFTISEAWKQQEKLMLRTGHGKDSNTLKCHLKCDVCCCSGNLLVMVGNSSYVHGLRNTQEWYTDNFIYGFCALVQHDAHMRLAPYKIKHMVKMVFSQYPDAPIKEILPHGDATHFVSVVFNDNHFAVLYYDIAKHKVSVFDGLNMKITLWQTHAIHTIKKYGLQATNSNCRIDYCEDTVAHKDGTRLYQVLDLNFEDGEPCNHCPWIVTNKFFYKQKDGYNCRPIACLKVMEIYGFIKAGSIEKIAKSPGGYCTVVMDYYSQAVVRYDDDLWAELRTRFVDKLQADIKQNATEGNNKAATLLTTSPPVFRSTMTAEDIESDKEDIVSITCAKAMKKKNYRQASSAIKEMK